MTGQNQYIAQYMELGDAAKSKLNYIEAAAMYEEAINYHSRIQSHQPIAEPSIKLGVCLCELARYKEAENILKRCVERYESLDNVDEAVYVRALTALAALYQAQSKYDAAIELHEQALPVARNMAGSSSTSLNLAENISAYAESLRKAGELRLAEKYHREALSIRTRAILENTSSELELAVSYTQLGCTLAAMNQHKEAYHRHHLALTLRYRYLDISHGLVAESLNYCAESLCELGRGEEGVSLAFHAVAIRKSIFGTSHPAYAHALSVLASCYHSVGRYSDACDCLETCLHICEVAFSKSHANIIPNLMKYGNVLRSTGDLTKARSLYQRAMAIHQFNFKEGQQSGQFEKCWRIIESLNQQIRKKDKGEIESITSSLRRSSCSTTDTTDSAVSVDNVSPTKLSSADIEAKGTPVIIFTDVGRDVDDEMALVLLSSLTRKHLLNPIAVITTLSPQRERAHLARGSLDTLGLAGVPVGIGGQGGVANGVDLEVYEADHSRSSSSIYESGMELVCQALDSVPNKSAQILCLASLSDMAELIQEHEDLFTSKVKEVVVMGGVVPMESSETLVPDTAYNNNCDLPAAKFVYEKCQELCVPTATLSRWAAYGCPIRPKLMDELSKTKHMVAGNIRRKSKNSLEQLYNKVILPLEDKRREKLPARCDAKWFYKTFCGTEDMPETLPQEIWSHVEKLNMYDPLAVLICVPEYRNTHFEGKVKVVNGVSHVVIGTSEQETGVLDPVKVYKEYSLLFIEALQAALHQPEMPEGSAKHPDLLINETAQLTSNFSRAA